MADVRCNCLALRQAARKVTQLYDSVLSEAGIRATQYHILAHLGRHQRGAAIGEMANQLVIDRATLGHNLRPLERDGLITFSVGDDRRARIIELTARGIAKLDEAKILWTKAQRVFESELGSEYSEKLRNQLGRVSQAGF